VNPHSRNVFLLVPASAMLGAAVVTTAWRVLGLRIEGWPPAMECSCDYVE
jgi:hypothetical protein